MRIETLPQPADPSAGPAAPPPARPPRPWLPITVVLLYWAAVFVIAQQELTTFARFLSRLGAVAFLALVFTVWWWVNRRIRFRDRLAGFLLVVAGGIVTDQVCDPSLSGFGLVLAAAPVVITVWALWVVVARKAAPAVQRWGFLVTMILAWGAFTLIRSGGATGEQGADLHWRWTPTDEELFLAEREQHKGRPSGDVAVTLTPGDWPGFRGPGRDGVARGVTIPTDWDTHTPRQVWKRRLGPGWSSLIVVGNLLFTQQQNGPREAVVCYDAGTGKELWSHEDEVRFYDQVADAGPRATPTFAAGRVCALGATGILNCLDAATGKHLWSHDIAAEAGASAPIWGLVGSPLVVDGLVVVFAGGDKGLLAYHLETGSPAWTAPVGQASYSSPQLAVLGGEKQILFLSDRGLTALDPTKGTVLWEHDASLPGAPRMLQPNVVSPSQVLFASETDIGLALLDVKKDGSAWSATQRWQSRRFKPSFNDFVFHKGHVYGFDGTIFACVDLKTGKRLWKEGRYDHGQVLLLADQSRLLVTTEHGEAVLLEASPERHHELGRFQAVRGKTWNHPAVVRGRLYVRNAAEMACYELGPGNGR
jgi:outer membrane protein assembly factor BamB